MGLLSQWVHTVAISSIPECSVGTDILGIGSRAPGVRATQKGRQVEISITAILPPPPTKMVNKKQSYISRKA